MRQKKQQSPVILAVLAHIFQIVVFVISRKQWFVINVLE